MPFQQSQTLSPPCPPSLSPFLCQVLGPRVMVRMVFSAVRQWRGPKGWPVPGHCAQGLGPSQYRALQFVGASGPVSPPFGFLLLLLAFFRNLLPFETRKGRITTLERALLLPAFSSLAPGSAAGRPVLAREGEGARGGGEEGGEGASVLDAGGGEPVLYGVSKARKWEGREGRAKPVVLLVRLPDTMLWLCLFQSQAMLYVIQGWLLCLCFIF